MAISNMPLKSTTEVKCSTSVSQLRKPKASRETPEAGVEEADMAVLVAMIAVTGMIASGADLRVDMGHPLTKHLGSSPTECW